MNIITTGRTVLRVLGLMAVANVGLASTVDITALYRPSATSADFVNTTPTSGFCEIWPSRPECFGENHSVGLGVEYSKVTIRPTTIERDKYWVGLPGKRTVQVVSDAGDSYDLQFSMNLFSVIVYGGRDDYPVPVRTGYVSGGCSPIMNYGNNHRAGVLWSVNNPDSPEPCHSTAQEGGTGTLEVRIEGFSVGYKLVTPAPLSMRTGTYRGSVTYSVGENGDIALGNGVLALNTSSVTLNFALEVMHPLAIEFPANSDRVVLEPPGGWMGWLNGGPAPSRLERDLGFRITNSGPLSVYMDCEFPTASSCAMRNTRTNETAPLEVRLTLPGGLVQAGSNAPIQRTLISTSRTLPLNLVSTALILNQPGTLHFSTAPGVVATMVGNSGDTYKGNVTVVFDADL